MIMMKRCTLGIAAVLLLAFDAGPVAAVEWLKGDGQSCETVCKRGGGKPVFAGYYKNTQDAFYVCSANQSGEGARPGYNLKPNWNTVCMVAFGGKELRAPSYTCACQ